MKQIAILFLFCLIYNIKGNSQNVPTYVPVNGLVGWWNLDGNAIDSSGLNNHGKMVGVVPTVNRKGEKGKALYFKGNNQRIEIPDHSSLRTSSLTISIWVQCENDEIASIVYKANRKDASSEIYSINTNPESSLKFYSGCEPALGWNSADFNRFERNYINLKKWTHIAISYDGNTLNQYINGIHVKSIKYNTPLDQCSGGNIHLGYCWDKFPFSFKGSLDDFGLWNRALSSKEIQTLFIGNSQQPQLISLKNVSFHDNYKKIDTLNIAYDSINENLYLKFNNLNNLKGYKIKVIDPHENTKEVFFLKENIHILNVSKWRLSETRVKVEDPKQVKWNENINGMNGGDDGSENYSQEYYIKIYNGRGLLIEIVKVKLNDYN